MLKVDTTYENRDEGEVHFVGSENTFVPPSMGPGLRLLVAEAPGFEEQQQGRPLVGGSGKMMDNLLRKAGVNRNELTVTNTICCRPPNNVYPTDAGARSYISEDDARLAVEHCFRSHLKPVVASRPWERIDAIGEKALRVLTGKTDGILKWRGSPLGLASRVCDSVQSGSGAREVHPDAGHISVVAPSSELGRKYNDNNNHSLTTVIPTLHPSFLMRTQYLIPAAISDLKKGTQTPPEFYNLEPTIEEVEAFCNSEVLCFDIETNRFSGTITMVGLSVRPYHVTVVPFRGAYIAALRNVFSTAKSVVGQNCIGFDLPVLSRNKITIADSCQVWDIMLMQHLLQPDMDHDLEFISSIFTQKPAWKHQASENMALYCARDVDVTLQAFLQLRPTLEQQKLMDLYNYVQVPLALICKKMTETGITTDPEQLKKLREQYLGEQAELESELPDALKPYDRAIKKRAPAPSGTRGKSGKPVKYISVPDTERVVPYNSPAILTEYLYGTLKLPTQLHKKTKKVTTDKAALERLQRICAKKNMHAEGKILGIIGKLGKLDTLISSFLKDDGVKTTKKEVIHANFLVHGTSTGRLSSSGPNMQNIPKKTRFLYVPRNPEWCFVEADFASLENRLAAWFANDTERLKRLDTPGFNEHRWLASQMFHIPEEEIDKESREYKLGKNTNHGADGAMGPRTLAMTYDIPEVEARELLFKWKSINAPSAQWQERTGNTAARDGILVNPFGRKRWFWTNSSYTEGIRFLPQGTGADICFRSMIALMYRQIHWPEELVLKVSGVLAPLPEPATQVLQVHDSILVETPQNLVEQVVHAMNLAMTQPWKEMGGFSIGVAFKVGKPGASWGECEDYKIN